MFNADAHIEVKTIAGQLPVLVIDDALLNPQALVQMAVKHRDLFGYSPLNAYPGVGVTLPDAITAEMNQWLLTTARRYLPFRRIVESYTRLTMVTLPPEKLQPRQWLCHRDRPQQPLNQGVLASVLYLFKNEALGGTNFFLPKQQGEPLARMIHDSGQMSASEFGERYGFRPGYFNESNHWFEKVLNIPARWNRLIVYDGNIFHCGDIRSTNALSDDPEQGRLTFNGFFTCRKPLSCT
ncbi:DUF6445 family protein [Permianibacter aggregans]|uniref:Phytanoyl-CoA dioxygenase PhyH n=1 Tax=Permianibacter aggregans TaxID=1510150 RepID=A0A4R6UQN5_9GAMM|nr:DUF6445 family protein [Permianibacter aggregans]QGX38459.1 hypothetical protein E2H98_01760 [Permianibacter aggregans]TDQ45574.1 hypothetical protein EV696_11942 [Permianibacter aggregans]